MTLAGEASPATLRSRPEEKGDADVRVSRGESCARFVG